MGKLFIYEKKTENVDIKTNQQTFINIFTKYVTREGSEQLLNYLVKSDFFTAPASTRFHGNFDGALCMHSLNVLRELMIELGFISNEYDFVNFIADLPDYDAETAKKLESIVIVALLHDLCKINFYKKGYRNVKNDDTGEWVRVTNYEVDEELPFGHGEKSVYIIQSFMNLTREEAIAIRWHMGDFQEAFGACSRAFSEYPLAVYLHIADLKASSLIEPSYDYVNKCWK